VKKKSKRCEVKLSVQVEEGAMFLREQVASGKTDDGKPFSVCLINMHTPAVEYDGRMFIFSLEELVGAVVEQAALVGKKPAYSKPDFCDCPPGQCTCHDAAAKPAETKGGGA
jgi:hypothetical protein